MPAEKPHILLLTTNLGLGGAQRVVRDHDAALAEHFTVAKAVFNRDGGDFYGAEQEFISLDVPGGGGPIDKLVHFIQRVTRSRRLKRELGTDICISHMEGADYVNLLSKVHEKRVLCIHGSKLADTMISGPLGWLRKAVLIPWLYNRADAIVTVSRGIVPELKRLGVHRPELLTINNFFDVDRIEAAANEDLPLEEEAIFQFRPVLITAGRLAIGKNQTCMLDLVAALKPSRPVRLVLLGDGDLRDTLKMRALELGLSTCDVDRGEAADSRHDVIFMGSRENPFIYLRRADLFLLTSEWEGFPMALSEAMVCGVPVISADCHTGPREILAPDSIRHGPLAEAEFAPYGVLAPIMNPRSPQTSGLSVWHHAVVRLLDDPGLRTTLATAARRRMEDFRKERIVGQWVALVERLHRP